MAERGTRAEIDLIELEKLCALHPTDAELASWFNVSTKTIERRKSEPAFAEAMERGRARGKLNLRRIQNKMAKNNAAMATFLGKNLLGHLRRNGHTLRGIAATLNHRALRTRRGSAWRLEHVARILKQDGLQRSARLS